MKKIITLKNFLVAASVFAVSFSSLHAEKRYYFALGGVASDGSDPKWQSDWVDLRVEDVDRTLFIWPNGESVLGIAATGNGVLGNEYQNFKVSNLGWWGCGYFVGPDAGNTNATMDLSDVDDTWYFNFSIKTNCAADITVGLNGCTADPDDPYITEKTEGKYLLNRTNFPLKERDETVWKNFSIPMSKMFGQTGTAGGPLNYKGILKNQNYLFFSGGNDTGSQVGWDNVYLSPQAPTGIFDAKVEKLDVILLGNELIITGVENNEPINIFSIQGAQLISSSDTTIDISALPHGVYVVKAANKVAKIVK